jgi:hypothetical protein
MWDFNGKKYDQNIKQKLRKLHNTKLVISRTKMI